MEKIVLNNGEYMVINELSKGGGLRALRHGQEWRDLAGDNLVLAMFDKIEALHSRLLEAENLLSEAHDVLDNVHCYEEDVYKSISNYFYGES